MVNYIAKYIYKPNIFSSNFFELKFKDFINFLIISIPILNISKKILFSFKKSMEKEVKEKKVELFAKLEKTEVR